MSRTYRKTSKKQGAPRWHQSYFNALQVSMKDIKPAEYRPRWYTYEVVNDTYIKYGTREPPTDPKDPRWVSKGVPHAIPEYVRRKRDPEGYYTYLVEAGRYFLPTKDEVIHRTYKKKVYNTPSFDHEEWSREYDHRRVFNHVRKNGYSKRGYDLFKKSQAKRAARREGKKYLLHWEDEYHLNQHLEPYNWVLDDVTEHPDYWIGLIDGEDDWADDIGPWCGYYTEDYARDPDDYRDNYIEPDWEEDEPYEHEFDPWQDHFEDSFRDAEEF